jgi:hypothetical protein
MNEKEQEWKWTYRFRFESNSIDYFDVYEGEKRIAYNIPEKEKVKSICDAHNQRLAAEKQATSNTFSKGYDQGYRDALAEKGTNNV